MLRGCSPPRSFLRKLFTGAGRSVRWLRTSCVDPLHSQSKSFSALHQNFLTCFGVAAPHVVFFENYSRGQVVRCGGSELRVLTPCIVSQKVFQLCIKTF